MSSPPFSTLALAATFALTALAGCGNLTEHAFPERVEFAPDGSLVVSLIGATQFLDGEGRAIVRSVATPAASEAFLPISRGHALSADGTRFATAGDRSVTVYATATVTPVGSITVDDGFDGNPSVIVAIALDGAGARLAVATGPGLQSKAVGHLRVFDVATQAQLIDVLPEPTLSYNHMWAGGVALSREGDILYFAQTGIGGPGPLPSPACFISAWRVADLSVVWNDVFVPLAANATLFPTFILALSPDGTLLAGGSWDTAAYYVWRTSDGSTAATLANTANLAVNDIQFSFDGSQIVLASAGAPMLFGVDGSYRGGFVPDTNIIGGVVSAALSPDGSRLASVFNSSLEIWNTADGSVLTQHDLKGQLD